VGNDLFHDYRAWKPLDLITIVINETAQGNKQANTRVTNSSSIEAAINNLIGIEDTITRTNKQIDNGTMISAETEKEFTGQGQTIRQDMLKATISAIVMEVLPSGLLRVEGEKIVTVNGEEQNMKISGLVRTRDINSNNEVLSSKIANARVDYYGRGTLGDSQTPGWLYQILNFVWPF
jgi:flagellar L-ring protein precursor FlgH